MIYLPQSTGYIPDRPDPSDTPHLRGAVPAYPSRYSGWHGYAPRPVSQGYTSACTAFAAMAFVHGLTSRMFGKGNGLTLNVWDLYARTRLRMGTFPQDSGAYLRDTMDVLIEEGAAPDHHPHRLISSLPTAYQGNRFRLPGQEHLGLGDRQDVIDQLRYTLGVEQLPVLVGMALPRDQFGPAGSGTAGRLLYTGGLPANPRDVMWHAMCLFNWDMGSVQAWTSWGPDFGKFGYLWIDNRYFLDRSWTPNLLTVPFTHA